MDEGPSKSGTLLAKLKGAKLPALERRLARAVAEAPPRASREVLQDEAPNISLLDAPQRAAAEILEVARKGVKVASHAESRSLLSLLAKKKGSLPAEFTVDHKDQKYEFYWVELTFSILLPKPQYPLSAEFGLVFKDDVRDPVRKSRAVRLFPAPKDTLLFKLNIEGAVGVDASMNLAVPKDAQRIFPYGTVSADAKMKVGMVLGPFSFQFRKAALEVKGENDSSVLWRYNMKSTLAGNNDFKSFMIVKVPEEAKALQMRAAVRVTVCKRKWLFFRDILPELSDSADLAVELSHAK